MRAACCFYELHKIHIWRNGQSHHTTKAGLIAIRSIQNLSEAQERFRATKKYMQDPPAWQAFYQDFAYRFCRASNHLEGNTLPLDETIAVVDGVWIKKANGIICGMDGNDRTMEFSHKFIKIFRIIR